MKARYLLIALLLVTISCSKSKRDPEPDRPIAITYNGTNPLSIDADSDIGELRYTINNGRYYSEKDMEFYYCISENGNMQIADVQTANKTYPTWCRVTSGLFTGEHEYIICYSIDENKNSVARSAYLYLVVGDNLIRKIELIQGRMDGLTYEEKMGNPDYVLTADDIPDPHLFEYLLHRFDANQDDVITIAESTASLDSEFENLKTRLSIRDYQTDGPENWLGSTVKSLKGIEYFTNVDGIYIADNNYIAELDLSKNTKICFVNLDNTKIRNLDFSNCKSIHQIGVSNQVFNNVVLPESFSCPDFEPISSNSYTPLISLSQISGFKTSWDFSAVTITNLENRKQKIAISFVFLSNFKTLYMSQKQYDNMKVFATGTYLNTVIR